jgi:hypothetical protein
VSQEDADVGSVLLLDAQGRNNVNEKMVVSVSAALCGEGVFGSTLRSKDREKLRDLRRRCEGWCPVIGCIMREFRKEG